MATYVDRRLTEKVRAAGETGQVEAVIVFRETGGSSPVDDDGELARQVVEGAIERTGNVPGSVRYFPRANAVVLSASGKLIREILKEKSLAVASATDVDAIVFV
jgi:hypothetical protein